MDLELVTSESRSPAACTALCTTSRKIGALIFGKHKTTKGNKAGIATPLIPAPLMKFPMKIFFVGSFVDVPASFHKEFEAAYRMYAS